MEKPDDKVSFTQKSVFGMGGISLVLNQASRTELAHPIYNITLGVSPIFIGMVFSIARIFDAFTDPIMGAISDNTRSRFGRRKPWIVLGAVLTGLMYPLLWMPPGSLSVTGIAIYFAVMMVIITIPDTIYSVPYFSIGYEMSRDYEERTRIMAYKGFIQTAAAFAAPWLYRLAQLSIFPDTMTGLQYVAWVVGLIILVTGVLPGLVLKEKFFKQALHQKKIGLVETVKTTFLNGQFTLIALISVIWLTGGGLVNFLNYYLNIYYVHPGDTVAAATMVGLGGTVQSLGMLVCAPVTAMLGRRFGKKTALLILLSFGIAASISKWFCYRPDMPYLQLLVFALNAPSLSGFWILTNSIKADVCDYDEWRTGLRREGIYGAVASWLIKVALSATALASGVILVASGFDQALGENQAPSTVLALRVMYSGIPLFLQVVAFSLALRFRLTPRMMRRMRSWLEKRPAHVMA